ncbi:unnamed protein product [Sphenostylis stenocarpa]|uniref:Uncharacterized protein n=1 Tax=Sphenostylis stenocarpa TaxID=92480 RepID=A0AA86T6I7_9FABA|nr:unnamed protein product [Sphenostylis stenocarpa]
MVSELSSPYPILGLQPALIYPYLLPLILLSLYAKLAKGLSEEMGVEELTAGGALSERLARGSSSIKRGFPTGMGFVDPGRTLLTQEKFLNAGKRALRLPAGG